MIRINDNKNGQAKIILEAIRFILSQWEHLYDFQLDLKDFDNCREQGYVLELSILDGKIVPRENSIHFAFAEQRNSDNIVIYSDYGYYDKDNINEHFWNEPFLFGYAESYQAAYYIADRFTKHIDKLKGVI